MLWVILALTLFMAFFQEWRRVLPSELALGMDPAICSRLLLFVSSIQVILLGFLFLEARRIVAVRGSLAVIGDQLQGELNGRRFSYLWSSLRRIDAEVGGRNARLLFGATSVWLPGMWLPQGWRRTLLGFRSPRGKLWLPRRKQHPLLVELLRLRPDLRVRRHFRLKILLPALLLLIATESLEIVPYLESRRFSRLAKRETAAIADFQAGRYRAACSAYETLLREGKSFALAWDVAETQVLCGDLGSALAAVSRSGYPGFPSGPSRSGPMGSSTLAHIRLAQGRYKEAERLLRQDPRGSYLLYLAVAKQGRSEDANTVLAEAAGGRSASFEKALLLRRTGKTAESRVAAESVWHRLEASSHPLPILLERPILVAILTDDPEKIRAALRRFAGALRELPGFRAEVLDFTAREAPERLSEIQEAIEKADRGNASRAFERETPERR